MTTRIRFIACLILAAFLCISCQPIPQSALPEDAATIQVRQIENMGFLANNVGASDLVWNPNEPNELIRVEYPNNIVIYNLGNGERFQLVSLPDLNLDAGKGPGLFSSNDGSVLAIDVLACQSSNDDVCETVAGVALIDLESMTGQLVSPPPGFENFAVVGMSADANTMLIVGLLGESPADAEFIYDIDNSYCAPFRPTYPGLGATYRLRAFSPDGEWIVASTPNLSQVPGSEDLSSASLVMVSVDGNDGWMIANNIRGYLLDVTFSPDGSKVVWATLEEGVSRIFIANIDGSGTHELFSAEGLQDPPARSISSNLAWSTDGMNIAFTASWNFVDVLWVLTLGEE